MGRYNTTDPPGRDQALVTAAEWFGGGQRIPYDPESAPATRSKTRSAPGVATASSSVSTRADSGSYGIRCPPPNHSAAVTSAWSRPGGSVVLYLPIGSLPHYLVDAVHVSKESGRCPLCY